MGNEMKIHKMYVRTIVRLCERMNDARLQRKALRWYVRRDRSIRHGVARLDALLDHMAGV